jgi:hypothetical protein
MGNNELVLIETIMPSEARLIVEENTSTKHSYLSGIFMQADVVNGNRRVYPLSEISNAVNAINEQIKAGATVFGELNHPDTLSIDLNNVSHIITEMWVQGSDAYGKARIIDEHPKGQIVKAIINAGGKLGVSSRGSGNVVEGKVSDFSIVTVDIVANPSAPKAYPNHVMEALEQEKKIMTLAEAVIHDASAQKYFRKELAAYFEALTGQQIRSN